MDGSLVADGGFDYDVMEELPDDSKVRGYFFG